MKESAADNTVSLRPEGYIEVALVGDQTYQSVEEGGKRCLDLIAKLRFEHKPVLGLIDFSRERGFNTGSNKAALEVLGDIDYDRVALFGSNKVLAEVIGLIVKALGKDDSTRLFRTREEALAWLMMKDPLA